MMMRDVVLIGGALIVGAAFAALVGVGLVRYTIRIVGGGY